MKALALRSFDDQPGLADVADPVAGVGEVLVRVHATSVNAYDVGVAAGFMKAYLPYTFPAIIGNDLSGIVEAVGADVEGFAVGDRVFGQMGGRAAIHDGSFAELANPKVGSIAIAPEGLSDVDAGSLAVAGTTAVSAVEAVGLAEGSRVLIVGATGGVGSFAIQLAALRGAHVIASARPGDEDFVKGLGSDETVDYTGDVGETIRERYPDGIDALIDAVNRDHDAFVALTGLVRSGGHAVSVVGGAGESSAIEGVSVSNASASAAHLRPLADLVVDDKVRVAVRRTYPLADAAKALADFANGHTLGKLVVTMV